jgi:hypothetical protein
MFKRDWLQYVAIGGVVVIAVLAAVAGFAHLAEYKRQHADERHTAANNEPKKTREQKKTTCVDVAKQSSFPCVVDTEPSDQADKYTHYDLNAQQDMAEWAFAMAALSGLGVLVTLAATMYVALTFNETRRMALASETANNATQLAVAISEDTAKRQLRAYISLESIDTIRNGNTYTVRGTFKNSGQTPATHVVSKLFAKFQSPDNQIFVGVDRAISKLVVGPGGFFYEVDQFTETDKEAKEIEAGLLIIFCWGEVHYVDVFGRNQELNFRCYAGDAIVPERKWEMVACEDGNSAT